jgi:hypothetical protein
VKRAALLLSAIALVVATGCSKADRTIYDPAPTPAPNGSCACPAQVVDPELLAFLSKARAAHHQADLAEDAKDTTGAIRVLDRLVAGPRPGGAKPPPEVSEVTADTRARLAELRSSIGQFDAAMKDIDEGLALATAPTHFRGHLYEVRGLVHERRMKSLAASGDPAGAEREKKLAIDAYEKAMATQDEVIRRALPTAEPPPPPR